MRISFELDAADHEILEKCAREPMERLRRESKQLRAAEFVINIGLWLAIFEFLVLAFHRSWLIGLLVPVVILSGGYLALEHCKRKLSVAFMRNARGSLPVPVEISLADGTLMISERGGTTAIPLARLRPPVRLEKHLLLETTDMVFFLVPLAAFVADLDVSKFERALAQQAVQGDGPASGGPAP